MLDYVYAIYSYLLDIDLYFKGRDSETLNIIRDMKKAMDRYVKNPSKVTFEEVYNTNNKFYDESGKMKSKYKPVNDQVQNLGEMIFRTKEKLYKFK